MRGGGQSTGVEPSLHPQTLALAKKMAGAQAPARFNRAIWISKLSLPLQGGLEFYSRRNIPFRRTIIVGSQEANGGQLVGAIDDITLVEDVPTTRRHRPRIIRCIIGDRRIHGACSPRIKFRGILSIVGRLGPVRIISAYLELPEPMPKRSSGPT